MVNFKKTYIQTYRLVDVQIDIIQLTETDEVGTDKNLQLLAFHFSLFTLFGVALVLKTNPKFVHLDKVGQNELNRIRDIPFRAIWDAWGEDIIVSQWLKRPQYVFPLMHSNKTYPSPAPTGKEFLICPLR